MMTNAQVALLAAATLVASTADDQQVSTADVKTAADALAQWLDDRDQFGPKKVDLAGRTYSGPPTISVRDLGYETVEEYRAANPAHVVQTGDLVEIAWDERTQLPEGTAPNHARRFNLLNNHRTCPLDGTAVTVETTTGHLICTAIPHHDWMPDAPLVTRPPKEMPLCMGCGGYHKAQLDNGASDEETLR